jgi:hypothetical protein
MAWYVYHTAAGTIVLLRDSALSVSKTSLTAYYSLLLETVLAVWISRCTSECCASWASLHLSA